MSARDLADADDCVSVSLGRHSNDLMTSFARTPSGFMVEYGWGGRDIAPTPGSRSNCATAPASGVMSAPGCRPRGARGRCHAPGRRGAGVRGPVQVLPGNHHVMEGACPWWDALRR